MTTSDVTDAPTRLYFFLLCPFFIPNAVCRSCGYTWLTVQIELDVIVVFLYTIAVSNASETLVFKLHIICTCRGEKPRAGTVAS